MERKFFLLGPTGSGKSSTGNKLTRRNNFTVGNKRDRVTAEVRIQNDQNGLIVGDFPGFGVDINNDDIFLETFLQHRSEFESILPIDALILIIKFDKETGNGFLRAAKQFVKLFGSVSIRSLMLLCIQGNEELIFSNDDFDFVVRNSDGYRLDGLRL